MNEIPRVVRASGMVERFSYLVVTLRRLPPVLYGFVLVGAWRTWTHVGGVIPVSSQWLLSTTGVRALTFGALLALYAWRARRGRRETVFPAAVQLLAAALGVLVTALCAAGVSVPSLLVMLVCGAVPAVFYLAWGMLYMRLQVKDAFACVLVMYILSAVLNGALFFIPVPAQAVVVAALLLVGGLLYVPACRSLELAVPAAAPRESAPAAGDAPNPPLWKFSLCLFVYVLAMGLLQGLVPEGQGAFEEVQMHAIEIVLALAFLTVIYVVRRPMRFAPLLTVLFTVLSGGLALACLGLGAPALVLFKIATSFLTIVIWTVAVDFCRRDDARPAVIVSLLFFTRSLATTLLFLARPAVPAEMWAGAGAGVVALWGLALATLLFVTEKDLTVLRLFDGVLPQGAPSASGVAEVDRRCREVAGCFGCTPRETEIMTMLCMGKSKAFIGEGLGLTESTVKSHVRNLYARLGIHSKNELQRLVGL